MNRETDHDVYLEGTLLELVKLEVITDIAEWKRTAEEISHHTMLFFVKMRGQLLMNQIEIPIHGKTLIMLLPGMNVQALNLSGNANSMIYQLEFDLFRIKENTQSRKVYDRELHFPIHGNLQTDLLLFQRKMQLLASACGASSVREHLRQQYLYALVELILKDQPPSIATPKDADASLQLTIQYMQDAYHTDINLDKLAEIAGMHPAYYSQRFKQKMNKSPIEFLTQVRMNKAKEILLVSTPQIRDLSGRVGYRDEFYFSRRFKENSGYAPTQYANDPLTNIVSLSYPYTDHLLTLGIVPSAAQFHRKKYLPAETISLTLPLHATESWEIGRKTFLEAQPGLILCKENVVLKAREHIGDIAPIISVPWASQDVFDHLEAIADLVGRRQMAKEWIERHAYKAEQAKKQVNKAFGSPTIAICRLMNTEMRLYGARNVGHVFYRSLQLSPPNLIANELNQHREGTNFNWLNVTPEDMTEYESDYVIFLNSTKQASAKLTQQIMTDPVWLRHPAIRQGRYFMLHWDEWMVYAPQAIQQLLEKAVSMLSEASLTSSPVNMKIIQG
ncbi:AraC family transcriptional regulator [Paenibacillus sp. 5J-6]|uniref:AraC family transcriptional regulator n=1 Tax=Paenibacillus silvestris TaxID=2606219 RepID=A0A6L8V628_9BACL|nr:helix-turn-helix domain-containing protein [Paenibacillus silvestris]MZQ85813.1 AraC family transcriptional regulator [Paenibacillus silvestris]